MRRQAFTMIELVVVLLLTAMLVIVAYQLIHFLTRSEQTIDREAQRAIAESTMMQQLLMDVRSSTAIQESPPGVYKMTSLKLPASGGPLEEQAITWQSDPKSQKVTRTVGGAKTHEFSFAGLLDPMSTAVRLRISKVEDALFTH